MLCWTRDRTNELSNTYLRLNHDIYLLNSTGITNNTRFKLYTYKTYQKNTANEQHAGIAIAIKQNIPHKLIDNFTDDTLAIQINTDIGPIIIATRYIPPRRNYIPIQDIHSLLQRPFPVYILGDLDLYHPIFGQTSTNLRGRTVARLIDSGLMNFLGPDFATLTAGRGKPDVILCNQHALLNFNITKGDLTTSDHLPIHLTLSSKPIRIPATSIYNPKRTDWTAFKNHIQLQYHRNNEDDLHPPENMTTSQIDEKIDIWFNKILTAREEIVPKSTINFNSFPLFSDTLSIQSQAYNALLSRQADGIIPYEHRELIRFLQSEIKIEFARLLTEHWNKLLRKIHMDRKDPSRFWEQVRRLKGSCPRSPPYLIQDDNTRLTNPEQQVAYLTKTWENIFQISPLDNAGYDLEHEFVVNGEVRTQERRTIPFALSDLSNLDESNFLLKKIQPYDIVTTIKSFKKRAPGISGIGKIYLENIPAEAIEEICLIFNHALSMGYFPNKFKTGIMILIPKTDTPSPTATDYRPITLLEVVGKIFEKIINNRLCKFLENNNLYHSHQFGFRKGFGTHLALAELHETLAIHQRLGHQCNVVSRDVSKAFDKVWHQGLKFKILQTTLPSPFSNLLCNFLDNRNIKIKFNNATGNFFSIKSGVPQGSILSPTLYSFYTHDLPPPGPDCLDIIFADDVTQITMYPQKSRRQLALITEREIERINLFEYKWKIKTNQQKFKLISISISKPHEIHINDRNIPFSEFSRILGLKLRRTGIANHVQERINIARRAKTTLSRFNPLHPKSKAYLFKVLVMSLIDYPITPLCLTSKTNIRKIQQFQNGFLRRIARYDIDTINLPINELHRIFKFEPINVRFHRRAEAVWRKLEELRPELVTESNSLNNRQHQRDHYWWKRLSPYILNPPDPSF